MSAKNSAVACLSDAATMWWFSTAMEHLRVSPTCAMRKRLSRGECCGVVAGQPFLEGWPLDLGSRSG